ncbi:PadR family transcriptional regulator [Paenibacillus sp. LMG 31461]|uniref:PadR family transcriptional regulator n=1 Tax=Paenibacillus plantarum TaxID=2654975 RepID=A0ABX1X2C2_9BACL|nr:helix-turn-helix transcriptional regulator [Paenibacillus plantarum]NOU62550.1 PadR family transcriptional regulator [Paenibacillus plantarum]
MTELENTIDKLNQELRRGTIVISVLSQLKEMQYGYSLVQSLNANGLRLEQNTLYPLLRRLESQNLLESHWGVDGSRPRRYYKLSADGFQALEILTKEWNEMVVVMNQFMNPKEGDS